jgi:hypothetical protein
VSLELLTAKMADDDNFDIDIYGDQDFAEQTAPQPQPEVRQEDSTMQNDSTLEDSTETIAEMKHDSKIEEVKQADSGAAASVTNVDKHEDNGAQPIASTGGSASVTLHKQAPRQQGQKRKQGEDDERPTDPGATAALMLNDLNWWIGEEDIRGWANQSGCEDELVEITFNEHKVNGKSKG